MENIESSLPDERKYWRDFKDNFYTLRNPKYLKMKDDLEDIRQKAREVFGRKMEQVTTTVALIGDPLEKARVAAPAVKPAPVPPRRASHPGPAPDDPFIDYPDKKPEEEEEEEDELPPIDLSDDEDEHLDAQAVDRLVARLVELRKAGNTQEVRDEALNILRVLRADGRLTDDQHRRLAALFSS